jgi:hypothetical protein
VVGNDPRGPKWKKLTMTGGSVQMRGLISLAVRLVLIAGRLVGFVEGLRIEVQKGWPTVKELPAESAVIVPSLHRIFFRQFRVSSVTIVKPYLSALRTTDGQLRGVSLQEEKI